MGTAAGPWLAYSTGPIMPMGRGGSAGKPACWFLPEVGRPVSEPTQVQVPGRLPPEMSA
jgi:hypothetical protein